MKRIGKINYAIQKTAGLLLIRLMEFFIRRLSPRGPFFNPAEFPFCALLETEYPNIRDEYAALQNRNKIAPIQETFREQSKITGGDNWQSYFLVLYGNGFPDANKDCPQTMKTLSKIPGIQSAMFSVLKPGATLPPHRGPYAGVLRCHLGISVPESDRCAITVNGETRKWTEGKCLVFDDSYTHSVSHSGKLPRVVLFLDIERKLPFPFDRMNRFLIRRIGASPFIQQVLQRNTASAAIQHPTD